jgi:hypothetical protein
MELSQGTIENVTLSEILELDTWNEHRTSEQLQAFINRRHAATVDKEEE